MIHINTILKDSICKQIFLQPTGGIAFATDTFVVNFQKDELDISLHSFAMVRLHHMGSIQYTVTDHYLNLYGNSWRKGQKKLSTITFPILEKTIKGQRVINAKINEYKDIYIDFENGAELCFLVDTSTIRNGKYYAEVHRILTKRSSDAKYEHFVIER